MGQPNKFRKFLGLDEAKENAKEFVKALTAEFVGTLFLVLIGCGSCIGGWDKNFTPSIVQISLAFGISVATMAQCIGHISGGHINPAVTCGMVMAGKCSLFRALSYIFVQLGGAIIGSALLKAVTPSDYQGSLGITTVHEQMTSAQGFGVEFLITFVLVMTVFTVTDGNRTDVKGSAPLAIGLSVTTCHLFAINFTGSSMNTARTFGPAVIMDIWDDHWVYWFGPILGGLAAGGISTLIFRAPPLDPARIHGVQSRNLDETEVIADRTTTI